MMFYSQAPAVREFVRVCVCVRPIDQVCVHAYVIYGGQNAYLCWVCDEQC